MSFIRNAFSFSCFFILISTFFIESVNAGVLNGDFAHQPLPFLLIDNPSLLPLQTGLPVGIQYSYDAQSEGSSIDAGVIIPFRTNALSVIYSHKAPGRYPNRVSAGFGHLQQPISLGGSFSFEIDSVPHLTVDAGVSLLSKYGHHLSLTGTSIVGTDSIQKNFYPSVVVSFGGPFPRVEDHIGFDLKEQTVFSGTSFNERYYNASFKILSAGFKNPAVYFSVGSDVQKIGTEEVDYSAGFDAGGSMYFGSISVGIFAGAQYSINKKGARISTGLLLNPMENIDTDPPKIKLQISKDTLHLEGFYFAISCNDGKRGSGIKQWTLIIYSAPSENATILKSFSGGNVPPSSIFWNCRDALGDRHEEEVSYAKFVAVDYAGNISITNWQKIPALIE